VQMMYTCQPALIIVAGRRSSTLYLHGKFRHGRPAVPATVSAKVGSIGDNRLGGWFSHRASEAALNMCLKTLAIEWQRTLPNVAVVGLHPGTTDTALSKPFQRHVPHGQLFTPGLGLRARPCRSSGPLLAAHVATPRFDTHSYSRLSAFTGHLPAWAHPGVDLAPDAGCYQVVARPFQEQRLPASPVFRTACVTGFLPAGHWRIVLRQVSP